MYEAKGLTLVVGNKKKYSFKEILMHLSIFGRITAFILFSHKIWESFGVSG